MALDLAVFQSRRATPALIVGGKDVLEGLDSKNITRFCYTDSTSDKADDLNIDIADPQRIWMFRYLPETIKKGLECTASVKVSNWNFPGDTRSFDCGIFFISDVQIKGPPNTVCIKATSIPPNGVKHTKKFRSWENSDLKSIAGEIAKDNKLELFYDATTNPKVKRTDQVDKSDIEYLRDRCKEATLALKIHKKQLVIYSEEEYDSREPAFTLTYGASSILEYDFTSKVDDTYKKSKNSYVNPETGKVTETEFSPEEEPEGTDALLIKNESIENDPDEDPSGLEGGQQQQMQMQEQTAGGDFEDINNWNDAPEDNKGKGAGGRKNSTRKCKAKLREKNKKEKEGVIKVFGNIEYLSSLTCELAGFGTFDKKWFIASSEHSIESSGFVTTLRMRGALKGY